MIDPVRFKKILVNLLKILAVVEILGAFVDGTGGHGWSRFGTDLIIAGVLYLTWERITAVVAQKKEEYRRKVEAAPQDVGLFDALIFSLLWTDAIYENIPPDRVRLIVISYTLIALGLVAAFLQIGSGLMPLVVSGALVLGAVNLATWVISLERGEKESLQTELKLAHDVQLSLMPKTDPVLPGFDIAGMSLPAANVGGDIFDYTPLGREWKAFGISVGDVSGKGMQAAMSAVFTSGAFASEALHAASPAAILTRLNQGIYSHSRRGHFVAFLLAAFDAQRKVMTFANAGQTRPLLKSGGTCAWLETAGVRFPLGMKEDSAYEEKVVRLKSGDILVLLTDGFTEAMSESQEVFGTERMEAVFSAPEADACTARELVDRATRAVEMYAGEAPQHDDMTIVVVKVL
jgi:serine phosphatase RsbU (regulator of sigma subunit)